MRKSAWLIVRLLMVASGAVTGVVCALQAPAPDSLPSFSSTAVWLVFPALGLLFIIGIQAANPRSDPVWRRPSWHSNPFEVGQPLQFFHVGVFHFLTAGAASSLTYFLVGPRALVWAAQLALVSAGTWLGIRLCILVYRKKLEAA